MSRHDRDLPVLRPHAAAVDVHSDCHVACAGPGRVRTFAAYSADLHALADWLAAEAVTSVVLESTGVYWIPLLETLEARGFEVFLIEPSQASHCGARPKTDVLDCQWLQRLHSCDLLRPRSGPPRRCGRCAGSGASVRCWCGTPRTTCSTCRRPWSR